MPGDGPPAQLPEVSSNQPQGQGQEQEQEQGHRNRARARGRGRGRGKGRGRTRPRRGAEHASEYKNGKLYLHFLVANNVLSFPTDVATIISATGLSATVVGAQNVPPRSHT